MTYTAIKSQILVDRKELGNALKKLASLKLKSLYSLYISVLDGNVLVTFKNDSVNLSITDLSTTLSIDLNAESISTYSVIVNLKQLQAIVKVSKSKDIDLSQLESVCNILDYPTLESLLLSDTVDEIKLSLDLVDGMQKVSTVVSTDNSKQMLCGLNIQVDGSKIVLAATDGHRLAVKTSIDCYANNCNYTIAGKHLSKLIKLGLDICTLSFTDNLAVFSSHNTTLSLRLIHGKYPDYNLLIPASFEHIQDLKSSDVIDGIEYLKVMDSREVQLVNLTLGFTPSVCDRLFDDSFKHSHKITNLSPYKTDDFNINFNPSYLLAGFKILDCNTVKVQCNQKLSPTVLTNADDSSLIYLLMPVQLRK